MVSQVVGTWSLGRSQADGPPNSATGTVHEFPNEAFDTALEHGLAILAALNAHGTSVSSAEAAALAGLARADAARSLEALMALGYANFDGHRYHLHPRTLRLGVSFMDASGIGATIARVVERLRPSLCARTSAVVLDGHQALYFPVCRDRLDPIFTTAFAQAADATSGGRVLLAFSGQRYDHAAKSLLRQLRDSEWANALPTTTSEVRREGFATVQDDAGSVQSLAVPVFDETLRCVCALELAISHMGLTTPELLSDVLTELLSVSRASSGQHCPEHPEACRDQREGATWHRP
jgi:IclR family transcriptional regulator, pca regulon regulatory protein